MKQQTIHFFTEKEEEFVNLLIEIGMKKNTAKVLVFLANITEATSRVIERGTDLRQPEVSTAIRFLDAQNWIASRVSKEESRGRRVKIYKLARPIHDIVTSIENKSKVEVSKKLAVFQKLRAYIIEATVTCVLFSKDEDCIILSKYSSGDSVSMNGFKEVAGKR